MPECETGWYAPIRSLGHYYLFSREMGAKRKVARRYARKMYRKQFRKLTPGRWVNLCAKALSLGRTMAFWNGCDIVSVER